MTTPHQAAAEKARDRVNRILHDEEPLPKGDALVALVKNLKAQFEYELAREVLAAARQAARKEDDPTWLAQQLALCTYKDETVAHEKRFREALGLLDGIGLRTLQATPETLALGGAVYKRMYEQDGQVDHLEAAIQLYERAWKANPAVDLGYGGVNAAFLLDVLASRHAALAAQTGHESAAQDAVVARARALREAMEVRLAPLAKQDSADYWLLVTYAEVLFGLGNHDGAAAYLERASRLVPDEWQQQSTFRQLLMLVRLQGHQPPADGTPQSDWAAPWRALAKFLGPSAAQAFSCWRGKVGLALSGGGFRASLFHLGVLARLAEANVLGSIEALSTVSGGSIVGAHYYLELQALLETTNDAAITRRHHVELVDRLLRRFLAGVQQNLRTRTLTNLACNVGLVVSELPWTKPYSRSHRIGELYESFLYAKIGDNAPNEAPRTMPQLIVTPAQDPAGSNFRPKFHNWRRSTKVPVLLLDTTSLNSGHAWHFTASFMGEPPGLLGDEVDVKVRYRRLYYQQAPTDELKHYRLGYAVAASACVPALFEPLELRGLYPGRTVRLVDGGVHDNQGVQGLLDEGCTFIFCSDASGQMDDLPAPADGIVGVLGRTQSVLMDRVREAEWQDLDARARAKSLQGLFFIHLKKELSSGSLDWIDCDDPHEEPAHLTTTSYGVDREIQRNLAAVRTDLDSFSEVEAYSLMLSGYLMTERELKVLDKKHAGATGTWGGFDVHAPRGDWPFLVLEPIIAQPPDSADLRRQDLGLQLRVGCESAFKAWRLSPVLKAAGIALLAAVAAGAVWLVIREWDHEFGPWRTGGIVLALVLAALAVLVPATKLLNPRAASRSIALKAVAATLGWAVANLHVHVFDKVFLARGRVSRLLKLPAP